MGLPRRRAVLPLRGRQNDDHHCSVRRVEEGALGKRAGYAEAMPPYSPTAADRAQRRASPPCWPCPRRRSGGWPVGRWSSTTAPLDVDIQVGLKILSRTAGPELEERTVASRARSSNRSRGSSRADRAGSGRFATSPCRPVVVGSLPGSTGPPASPRAHCPAHLVPWRRLGGRQHRQPRPRRSGLLRSGRGGRPQRRLPPRPEHPSPPASRTRSTPSGGRMRLRPSSAWTPPGSLWPGTVRAAISPPWCPG